MNKKILIIEDDSFLSGLEAGKLQKDGYEVMVKATGTEGLAYLSEHPVDCVLLDLMLPGTDGFQVLEHIKQGTEKKPPVIVFSNMAEDENIKKALDLGAIAYMIKSNFTLDELSEKIGEITKL